MAYFLLWVMQDLYHQPYHPTALRCMPYVLRTDLGVFRSAASHWQSHIWMMLFVLELAKGKVACSLVFQVVVLVFGVSKLIRPLKGNKSS